MLEPENPAEVGLTSTQTDAVDVPVNEATQNHPVGDDGAVGNDNAAAQVPPSKPSPRKRAPRKATTKATVIADQSVSTGETVPLDTATSEPSATELAAAPAKNATPAKKTRKPAKKTAETVSASEQVAVDIEPASTEPATESAPPRTRKRGGKKASADSDAAASDPAVADSDASAPAMAAPAVLFVAPAPALQPAPRARRRAKSPAVAPETPKQTDAAELAAEETLLDGLVSAAEELDESSEAAVLGDGDVAELLDEEQAREIASEEASGARRRRRRGRRGRGGRSTASEVTSEQSDLDEDSAEEGDDAEDSPEGDESSSSSARRRRRRRRSADSAGPDTDDPPNTVTHVRSARTAKDSDDDGVRGVKGSTRLEAKRQRRRDGRDTNRRRQPILTEAEFLARRESVDRVMAARDLGDRTQIAVLEDGILVEHYVTRATSTSYAGNVYLGRVQNVLPSMEAAFVDIGKARNGVLYAGEVNWDAAGIDGKARAIENALSSGDTVLVQVTKDPIGQKGARLTSQVSLPGRYLVYVPNGAMTGISRKLPDNERTRLKSILKKIVPEDAGVIVRTAAEGASEIELTHDVERLTAQWESIQAKANQTTSGPTLLYGEPDLAIRVVRDVFNEDFTKLVVQGDEAYATIAGYVGDVAPDLTARVSKYTGTGDLFHDLRVDEQLTKALDRKVYLPSGGSLVIDRTEAMTVIDVNTGKFVGAGGNLEQTVTRNNLEAAEEIVRQLRLRDVGGIVVIDFIDMVLESNRELVLRRLTECLGRDRTKHQVAEVTSLGLVQMTRKRVGEGLLEAFSEPCEHCKGRGVLIHTTPVSFASEDGDGEDSSKRRNRRPRAKTAAPAEPIDPESVASEEQRRKAAAAMAAMAGAVAGHEASEQPGAGDATLDSVVPDSADSVDDNTPDSVDVSEDVTPAVDQGVTADAVSVQVEPVASESIDAEVVSEAEVIPVGPSSAPTRRPRRRAASPAGPPVAV